MKTVLIVDDEFTIVETLVEILTWEGYQTATAPNGDAALKLLATVRPDAILLDYMMPLMDGLQFLKALRASPEHARTPVIMMTAAPLGVPQDQRQWDLLMIKPFDAEQLTRALRRLLEPRPAT